MTHALAVVLPKQRKTFLVAVLLTVAAFWIAIPAGRTPVGVFFGIGIFLSFFNHILAEVSLYNTLERGDELSRKQFAMGSLSRLTLVTVIALAIGGFFWPDGAAVFIGLALMHLIMLLFTGLPLLNEMRKA